MNNLDKRYQELLQDILDNGVEKKDRTGTGTISVFGRQIRHKMSEGFPLLTTKRMPFKTIMTELLWFLRGDTNIKFLVDNGCHIWDGDAFKNFMNTSEGDPDLIWNQDQFIEMIKTDDEFAKQWGQLGPVYGKQWRSWGNDEEFHNGVVYAWQGPHDQIKSLIEDLKTNPDSRRLMVTAWNPAELQEMVLPPCHYGFQVYTRELTFQERLNHYDPHKLYHNEVDSWFLDELNVPTRAISLMWNQRSVDTFLGLPFNIASYGLLLEIIAKAVNMVPDELIGNLGDVHLYSNHVEQAKEQIGREMTWEEQVQWVMKNTDVEMENLYIVEEIAKDTTPKHTRQPYLLPILNINTEFWPKCGGESGVGPIDANAAFEAFKDANFCKCMLEEDVQLSNYVSHPKIKAPLSN
jgi:thymidylate synthase